MTARYVGEQQPTLRYASPGPPETAFEWIARQVHPLKLRPKKSVQLTAVEAAMLAAIERKGSAIHELQLVADPSEPSSQNK